VKKKEKNYGSINKGAIVFAEHNRTVSTTLFVHEQQSFSVKIAGLKWKNQRKRD